MLAPIGVLFSATCSYAGMTINVDLNNGSANHYAGTAVAPDSGTVWNDLDVSGSPVSLTISDVSDSQGGILTGVDVTIASHDGTSSINRYSTDNNTTPSPLLLMRDYTFSGTYDITVVGLTPGTYDFWFFGHGDQASQTGGVTVDVANGGGGGATADSPLGRDLINGGDGISYVHVGGVIVDGSGTFSFQVDSYFNGFQLAEAADAPVIDGLPDRSVGIGANVTLEPTVNGAEPISYQWRENGVNMVGETNSTLTLLNVQMEQDGYLYSLIAGNTYGSTTNSMTLTVSNLESFTINVDLNNGSSQNYTGTAVASDSGTVWNDLDVSSSPISKTISTVKDSQGNTLSGIDITIASHDGTSTINRYSTDNNSTPNPQKLMTDYTFGGTYDVTVSGLPAGTYGFWYFGHGDQNSQAGTVTIDIANGGGIGSTANSALGRDLVSGGEGISYVSFDGVTVDSSGTFSFEVDNFLNGFQLQLSTPPVVTGLSNQTVIAGDSTVLSPAVSGVPYPALQWQTNGIAVVGETNASLMLNNVQYEQDGTEYSLVASNAAGTAADSMILTVIITPSIAGLNNQAVAPGTDVTLASTVSGVPSPILQWYYNGELLSDGATGYGSIVSGSDSDTLSISNAQEADSGLYSLIASNSAGVVTNAAALTVSSVPVAPDITGPMDQTVVQGNDAIFSASVAGLPIPTLQWQLNGSDLSGETNESLTVSSVAYAQNGDVYTLVATNDAGVASSASMLFVQVPPSILQQPTPSTVMVGSPATFSVIADGVPAVSYQWSLDGSPIAGATNSSYTLPSVSGTDNGAMFSVEVANSVGSVTSSAASLTVLSSMTGTLLPSAGATEIAPDQQLRIVFSNGTAQMGSGILQVRDASDDSLFATIDTSEFITFSNDSATSENGALRTLQGRTCYYEPIAIDDNTAWITLSPTNRFEYGKTYYVTFDTGLFRDSSNASYPGITDSGAWNFSTKISGPATPTASTGPTEISVGLDGAGDFATLQGASDWVPQNNTLNRTIKIEPGTYRDYALFDQNRDNVTIIGTGADRKDVYLYYPYPTDSGNGIGVLTLASSDVTVRNLDLDTKAYETFPGRMRSLISTSDRLVFENVLIRGGQDTIYARSGSIYFKDCEVWGSVDFVYGAALTVFDECTIVQVRASGGPIGAPNTDLDAPYGEVFLNCTFPRALVADGYPYDVGVGTTTFMRAWGKDGMLAAINCELGSHFSVVGWSDSWDSETTCRVREYGSYGPGSVSVAARQAAGAYWLNTIDPDYVANPSLPSTDPSLNPPSGHLDRISVTVDPSDYTIDAMFGHPSYGLGSWRPTSVLADPLVITAQPIGRAVVEGANVSLSLEVETSTGVTNYQWQVDSGNITAGNVSGIESDMLSITDFQAINEGAYHVDVSDGVNTTNSNIALLTLALAPVLVNEGVSNGLLQVQVPTEWGPSYLVQTNSDLMATNWQVAETIVGDGDIHLASIAATNSPELFIRIKVQ